MEHQWECVDVPTTFYEEYFKQERDYTIFPLSNIPKMASVEDNVSLGEILD